MHALFAVLQVGVEPLGLVTLPPGHIIVGEQTASMLVGGWWQFSLEVIIYLCTLAKYIRTYKGNPYKYSVALIHLVLLL